MTEAKCTICGEPMPAGEEMFKFHGYSGPCPKQPIPCEKPSRVEVAYGLLWMEETADQRVHEARRLLLETMSKQNQERGINAAKGMNLCRRTGDRRTTTT